VDLEATEAMLRHFLGGLCRGFRKRPSVAVCVPTRTTQVEREAVTEATLAAGASAVWLIEEPLAAAIGAELPVDEAVGSLVVDFGGGTTTFGIIASGGIVVSNSVRVGGDDFDAAIVELLRERKHLLIGLEQAEALKICIGSVLPAIGGPAAAEVSGRDRGTGLVRRAEIGAEDLRYSLERPLSLIVKALRDLIECAPPELLSDVAESGIVLVGGGAMLRGLAELLRRETGLPITIVERPLTAVANGAGRAIDRLRPQSRAAHSRALRHGLTRPTPNPIF
jgi:rod shape-determining protein MreB